MESFDRLQAQKKEMEERQRKRERKEYDAMRVSRDFHARGEYHQPEEMGGKRVDFGRLSEGMDSLQVYQDTVRICETAYQLLLDSGVPEETAILVVPRGVIRTEVVGE